MTRRKEHPVKVPPDEKEACADKFLSTAKSKLDDAKTLFGKRKWVAAAQTCQETIELSLKATSVLALGRYYERHYFTEDEIGEVLGVLPDLYEPVGCNHFARLFLLSDLWFKIRKLGTYGYRQSWAPTEKYLKEDEAKLALDHADECYWAAFFYRQRYEEFRPGKSD